MERECFLPLSERQRKAADMILLVLLPCYLHVGRVLPPILFGA